MGQIKGFLDYQRKNPGKQPVDKRIKHWDEFTDFLSDKELKEQAARCMDCGTPFCHWSCPVINVIPDFNDFVYRNRWEDAYNVLKNTNNFPEFTGRICPAPCESSCVLGITDPAVTIKNIELTIIEKAYEKGWVKPRPPKIRTGKKVAIVGSGPSGLACADQLNKAGHKVTVFEKNELVGGLLTIGIPTFKLNKHIVERRINLMIKEGIEFKTRSNVGIDITAEELKKQFDAVVLCGGAESPRDLPVSGRDLKGVYFAMEYLSQQTRVTLGQRINPKNRIDAKGKNVIVIGGGDTGSDCVGTANRQGAKSVKQFELLPESPKERTEDNPWPQWDYIKRISTSHEEGVKQFYQVMTKEFIGKEGILKGLNAVKLDFGDKDPKTGRCSMKEIEGSEFKEDCDLVFLAMGFLGPVGNGLIDELGCELDQRSNVKTDINYMSSIKGIFSAGDMRTGQSLVVRAINEGRNAAESVNNWLLNS